jgi:2'-5' RNA ligase
MARLFFAVWPDGAAAAALARLAADVAQVAEGRAVPSEKIHLTLAFLGETDAGRMEAAAVAARGLRFAPFHIVLDRVGSFRAARVAWAGSREMPRELAQLQAALAARLAEAGFALEARPFAPHATLARGARKPLPLAAIAPIEWRVDAFTLVRTERGSGRYTVMEEFPAR